MRGEHTFYAEDHCLLTGLEIHHLIDGLQAEWL